MTADRLDLLAHHGWPALEVVERDGWLLRFAGGVTQRANSALPLTVPRAGVPRALEAVVEAYAARGLPPLVQVSGASPSGLADELSSQGWSPGDVAVAEVADVALVAAEAAGVELSAVPSQEWLDLWWSVDGRGGDAELEVARRILTGCPSVYALARDGGGPVAVGRLALVEGWGGAYCLAVRSGARRQGHGTRVLRALAAAGRDAGAERLWLQVLEHNAPARAAYERLGFAPVDSYRYWRLG
ncbi:acetyltransferase (GNAT) family protein [Motilibacter rhizosphaerae]|uniref:Acetyltransferase (GNAT) family protein n=1 Tax=Motilibacter rhizosphaerae TaxID=598652 RepID=A0A4Q7NSZ4_9ACTN|nr:GNAT family N-acetyltransferase [Motilibacter rhizosphaerae]RZS90227.1 acetyltransferase (GNAT) family protein [Motilibacter rhizosphaerae]